MEEREKTIMSKAGNMIIGLLSLALVIAAIGYGLYRSLRKSEDPGRLVMKWIISVVLLGVGFPTSIACGTLAPLVMLCFAVPVGLMWAPAIGEWFAKPLTNIFDGGDIQV